MGNVQEITVGRPNSHIQDEVEWPVKRRVGIGRFGPWVFLKSVRDAGLE